MPDAWDDFNLQPMDTPAGVPSPVVPDHLQGIEGLAHNQDTGQFYDPAGRQFFNAEGAPVSHLGTLDKSTFASKFTGPLAAKADLIEQKSQQYGVPPSLATAIIAQETGWGRSIGGNNVAGMMRGGGSQKMQFGSLDEGIDKAVANIAKQYERGGRNLEGLRDIYAPIGAKNDPNGLNKDWLPGVQKIMGMFGGQQ